MPNLLKVQVVAHVEESEHTQRKRRNLHRGRSVILAKLNDRFATAAEQERGRHYLQGGTFGRG